MLYALDANFIFVIKRLFEKKAKINIYITVLKRDKINQCTNNQLQNIVQFCCFKVTYTPSINIDFDLFV